MVYSTVLGEEALAGGQPALARVYLEVALRHAVASGNRRYRTSIENTLGVAESELGESVAARRAWMDVLSLEPGNREALLNLAGAEAENGQIAKAKSLVRRELLSHPRDASALVLLFRLELADGNRTGSEAAWKELVQVSPSTADSVRLQLNLGR